jgi:hypothetical protein
VGGVAFERDDVNVPLWGYYVASMVLCSPCGRWPAGTPLDSLTRSPFSWPGTRCRSRPSASAAPITSRSWRSASAQPGSTRSRPLRGLTRTTASLVRAPALRPAPCPATTSTSPCAHGIVTTCPVQASCGAYYGRLRSGKASAWAPATTGRRLPTASTSGRARRGSPASTASLRALWPKTQRPKTQRPKTQWPKTQWPKTQRRKAQGPQPPRGPSTPGLRLARLRRRLGCTPGQGSGSGPPSARLAVRAGGT